MGKIIKTDSAEETMLVAGKFSRLLKGGSVILFEGALGGGKTTFVRGLLKAAGYKGRVLSPAFTLIREYEAGKLRIYHLDLYRLDGKKDLFELGVDGIIYSDDSVFLIEWGEKIEASLKRYTKIIFSYLDENSRRIAIKEKR